MSKLISRFKVGFFILITTITVMTVGIMGTSSTHPSIQASTVYSYNWNSKLGSSDYIRNYRRLRLPHAAAAVAMDARTGQILYQKNANQRRLVASTGKLMDLYLAGRKINNTPHAWSDPVHINPRLRRMSYSSVDGGYHFRAGHRYTVGNLMKAGIIASSNNAAIALGQWVGHSNRHFLQMENHQSRLWHLRAHFVSASGLENDDLAPYGYWQTGGRDAGNEISAKSLAIIAYHVIHDEPWFLKYSRVGTMHEDGQRLYNYNELLPHHQFYRRNLHVDGLKTGWTPAAGYCFVGTAKWPRRDRIITVVLHDNHQWHESMRLMRYVYRHSRLLRTHA